MRGRKAGKKEGKHCCDRDMKYVLKYPTDIFFSLLSLLSFLVFFPGLEKKSSPVLRVNCGYLH